MKEIQKAKFFKTGGSRALRIPASYFVGSEEVWLRWDETAQTLTISSRNPKPFEEFFQLAKKLGDVEIPDFQREPDKGGRPEFENRMRELWGE